MVVLLPKSALNNVFMYYVWSFKVKFVFKVLLNLFLMKNFVSLIKILCILFLIK